MARPEHPPSWPYEEPFESRENSRYVPELRTGCQAHFHKLHLQQSPLVAAPTSNEQEQMIHLLHLVANAQGKCTNDLFPKGCQGFPTHSTECLYLLPADLRQTAHIERSMACYLGRIIKKRKEPEIMCRYLDGEQKQCILA